jgi:hypothetical protein
MKALTIRHVDARLARALERERTRRGVSLNQAVLDLLQQALGIDRPEGRSNGLAKHGGTWSDDDLAAFERATAVFEQVDEELWG